MAQERFADVVERFTGEGVRRTHAAPRRSSGGRRSWSAASAACRTLHGHRDAEPGRARGTGQTPRVEVYKRNKSRLFRYESSRTHRTPVLFVPNLGISRPYIFDLLPGGSFVEHMTRQGFDFYLLDWGVFGPEDNDLTVEDCVTRILPRMARRVLETSGTDEALGARLLHGRADLGLVRRDAPGGARCGTSSTWPAPSTSRRSGCSGSGSASRTSTSTASSTPWARCPPIWSRRASSSSSPPWTSRPT